MSLTGWVLQLVYRFHRHFWLDWSLARWLGVLLAQMAALVWAGRRGFAALCPTPTPPRALRAEEMVPVVHLFFNRP